MTLIKILLSMETHDNIQCICFVSPQQAQEAKKKKEDEERRQREEEERRREEMQKLVGSPEEIERSKKEAERKNPDNWPQWV